MSSGMATDDELSSEQSPLVEERAESGLGSDKGILFQIQKFLRIDVIILLLLNTSETRRLLFRLGLSFFLFGLINNGELFVAELLA